MTPPEVKDLSTIKHFLGHTMSSVSIFEPANDYNYVTFLWLESTTHRMYVALFLVQRGLSLGAGHMAEASKVNTSIHFHSPEKTSSLPTSSTHPLKQQSKGSQQKR